MMMLLLQNQMFLQLFVKTTTKQPFSVAVSSMCIESTMAVWLFFSSALMLGI